MAFIGQQRIADATSGAIMHPYLTRAVRSSVWASWVEARETRHSDGEAHRLPSHSEGLLLGATRKCQGPKSLCPTSFRRLNHCPGGSRGAKVRPPVGPPSARRR